MAITPIQKKAANQSAWVTGCSTFVGLLLLSLLFHGMPAPDYLIYLMIGSLLMGVLGYYMGIVVSSPIVVKGTGKRKRSKANPSLRNETIEADETLEDDSFGDDEEEIQESEGLPPHYEQMQDSIPANNEATSAHEWVDTARTPENTQGENKTKAFEA
ncbi:MAG: hypothetical protein NTW61_02075 [Candidatus Melainabacteria bacterium]|nr:hypothetical protein [Candidatus Melainabacteria bacterium]